MGRWMGRTCVALALAVAPWGCSRASEREAPDAGQPVQVPAPVAAPVAAPDTVANQADVKRYSDEKPLEQASVNIEAGFVDPRTEAGMGSVVTTLPKGTSVKPLAQKGPFVLVQFSDPKDSSRTLLGWVQQAALKTAPRTKPVVDAGPDGHAVSPWPTAPPAPTTTASTAPTTTASIAPTPPPAPTTPPAGTKLPIKTALMAGKCNGGYTEIQGKYCRLNCANDGQCATTAGAKCQKSMCFAPGEKP